MMGFHKPQRFAKFEDAGFICYGNIREFENLRIKIGVNQNGETPYYLEKLILPLDSQTIAMFPIRCATVVELRLQQMGDFYKKTHFTMKNFKFREAVSGGYKFLH